MTSLLERLKRYKPEPEPDLSFDPTFDALRSYGIDMSTIGKYQAAPFDDPLTYIAGMSDDIENAASAVYDDPTRLYRSPLSAAGKVGKAAASSLGDALSAPYRALTGDLDDPETEAMNMAGWLMGGGFARAAKPAAGAELGMFGGKLAKTADLDALAKAESFDAAGTPREAIWDQTGWFKGKDGKWRFEIDDSGAKRKDDKLSNGNGFMLDEFKHSDLRSAYPQFGNDLVKAMSNRDRYNNPGIGGSFKYNTDRPSSFQIEYRADDPLSLALHELQHRVQREESFAPGGNTVDQQYNRLSGEVEARAVQARKDLSASERRARYPWLDYDVPEADQIVRFADGSGGPQMSVEKPPLPMDFESRMARAKAMGFDVETPLYHGTGKDFSEFDPGTRGNGSMRNIYLTDNPDIAEIYANSQNYGLKGGGDPMTYPLYAKSEQPLIVSDKGPDGSFGWVSDNLASALNVGHPSPGRYASLYDEARRQGYDQVQIREMTDLGGQQTQYIPLASKNIRSVNAAFDPDKIDSADLLAAGHPLFPALPREDRKKRNP